MVVSLKYFQSSGVNIIFFLFLYLSVLGGLRKNDWCFIESVCLLDLSDSIWCFLLHFYLSSYSHPSNPPQLHHFRSGCQSTLLIFKGSRAWNRDSEHGPDFHSLIFLSHFSLSQQASLYLSLSHFLIARVADNRQLLNHGTTENTT